MRFPVPLLRTLGLGVLAVSPLGCERLANVQLTLVEPCNQRNVALAGVQTFRLTVEGKDPDTGAAVEEITTFTRDNGAQPLQVVGHVDDAIITVEAWEGNAEENAAVLSAPPKAIGRTMPLDIEAGTRDMDITLTMGLLDGLGQTTNLEGSCQSLNNRESDTERGRHGHTATYVPGLNKVLVVGGAVYGPPDSSGVRSETYLRTVELFDPATGLFEEVADMPTTRAYHTATALPDGRVLIAGGFATIDGAATALKPALLYDPNANKDAPFTTVTMVQERALHTATLLEPQGLVVFVGGCSGNGCSPAGAQNLGGPNSGDPTTLAGVTVEVFDIAGTRFVAAPGASGQTSLLDETRAMHAVSALEGGRLLVSGGVNANGPVCGVEILEANVSATGFTLVNRSASGLASVLPACPSRHAQVTLGRNRVAIIGGQTEAPGGVPVDGPGSNQVVFWNTTVGVEMTQGSLLSGRAGHQATLLDDGSILVVGGAIEVGGATTERLMPPAVPEGVYTSSTVVGPPLQEARDRLAIARLPTNQVFVSGGHTAAPERKTSESAEIYYGE